MRAVCSWIWLCAISIVVSLPIRSEELHEDESGEASKQKPFAKPRSQKGIGGCDLPPGSLSQFATGERYDLHSMVTFLTQAECIENAKAVSATEMVNEGMKFSTTSPINLLSLTQGLSPRDFDALRRLDSTLQKQVPTALRNNPLGQTQLLTLVGQLSLLSPSAARFGMVKLMEQELTSADTVLSSSLASSLDKKNQAKELATNLARLGANEPVMISEIATTIEEMASLAQADSLSKVFRGLIAATDYDGSLIPTFNASASAVNRGVEKADKVLAVSEKERLMTAIFSAIVAASNGNDRLDPGNNELNEAIGHLIEGKPLQLTALKKAWREIVRILAVTSTQTALADAFAVSLTPEMAFVGEVERRSLLEASLNYPVIGFSVQRQLTRAVENLKNDVLSRKIATIDFNETKSKRIEPMVGQILSWETFRIHPVFLNKMVESNLITTPDVEKKMPRHVLVLVDQWQQQTEKMASERSVDLWILSSAQSFAVNYSLNRGFIPALNRWVKLFEEENSSSED